MKTVKRTTDRELLFAALLFLIVSLLGLASPTEAEPKTAVSPRGNCVEGEVLVVFKNKVGEISAKSVAAAASEGGYLHAAARTVGASAIRSYSSLSAESDALITLFRSETKTTEQLMEELKRNPDVLSVSPNRIMYAASLSEARPNDARYGELWGMEMIGASAAWAVTSGDFTGDIYVAVIDSGIAKDHEDLKDNIAFEYCRNFASEDETAWEDENGHGTHVAGTIGAVGNNGAGVAGVNWKTKIIVLRTLDKSGSAPWSNTIAALDCLVDLLKSPNPPKIAAVNLSLGGGNDVPPEEAVSSPLSLAFRALDKLPNAPVIVVAAGNNGMEVGAPATVDLTAGKGDEIQYIAHRGEYEYPASFLGLSNMIVVGSVASTDVFAPRGRASYFSNWSSKYVQLAAPGGTYGSSRTTEENKYQNILSVSHADADGKKADNEYVYMAGTSMAAPHVTGAVALLASRYPDLNAARLKSRLLVTANHDYNPETDHVAIASPDMGANIERQKAPDYKLSKYGLLDIGKAVTTPPAEIPLQSVTLTAPDVSECEEGDVFFLSPAFEPEEATEDRALTWKSSNSDVASVTRNTGMVTVLKTPGRTTITAAASDGKISGAVELTFGDPEPEPAPTGKSGGGCSAAWPGAIGFILIVMVLLLFTCRQA
ncbi:MAG: S8 family serine peptidase [Synergistaceae bacterium]|jgi:subtilisin family serine protease|nr:S8 family serine peptidase [Synergistaceae bacterium]